MSTFRIVQYLQHVDLTCLRWFYQTRENRPWWSSTLSLVSRLGDGWFWYAILAHRFFTGTTNDDSALLHIILTAGVVALFYRVVKDRVGRPRPCEAFPDVEPVVAPLDRWSFPSGHTMHAVCFTICLAHYYPGSLTIALPFTILVMLSRVILGLHYPSDVFAGAVAGATIAWSSLAAFGVA